MSRTNRNRIIRRIIRKVTSGRRLVFIPVLALAVLFLLPKADLYASASHEEIPTYKYYTDIRISCGDTLCSIADRFYTVDFPSKTAYIEEVRFINHLEGDRIEAGDFLIVPYYSTEVKP